MSHCPSDGSEGPAALYAPPALSSILPAEEIGAFHHESASSHFILSLWLPTPSWKKGCSHCRPRLIPVPTPEPAPSVRSSLSTPPLQVLLPSSGGHECPGPVAIPGQPLRLLGYDPSSHHWRLATAMVAHPCRVTLELPGQHSWVCSFWGVEQGLEHSRCSMNFC